MGRTTRWSSSLQMKISARWLRQSGCMWTGRHISAHVCFTRYLPSMLVSLHGVLVPLAYCLLPDKRQETYQRVLPLLHHHADELGLELAPTTVTSDFEQAILQGTTAVFPAVRTKGCYFHFCQALIRKFQHLGLQKEYQENPDLNSFVRRVAALAFVPLR